MPQDKSTDNEDDLFREMMSDVTPLPDDNRLVPGKPKPAPKPRPQSSQSSNAFGFAAREHVPNIAPEEILFFARPGIQHRETRRLKRGEFSIEATIDLHGCTITEAGQQLQYFLHSAIDSQLKCVCVVHGKGYGSEQGRPVLKSQVNQWLRDMPAVLAFCSAQPQHGGTGAVYVLLSRK